MPEKTNTGRDRWPHGRGVRGRRTLVLGTLGIAAALTATGCSADQDSTAAHPAPETTTVQAAAGALAATVGTDGCATGELQVTLGQAQGAAGSSLLPLVFTNTGTRTCVLDGFPGVSYVQGGPDGTQVGAAATREGPSHGTVTLAPDAAATAQVRAVNVANYPAEACASTPVAGLRVYPPNDTDPVFVPYATTGCSATGDSIDQLSVQAVTG
ncbi:DUF4232 domain-containing protein [Prescottella subtropica]|uniref:DUF4232 domain-containing protein n=1 Tax=Prescottella subtropica TaxID=2545757 RepID=UPI0010F6D132|nr:DUF4232 domain-containing protein [Prescottella subtropica]